jgi:hypothetical protein
MSRAEMKFEQAVGSVRIPISKGYQNLMIEGFAVTAFWSHVTGAIEVAKINELIDIPQGDSETLARVIRAYFEANDVYSILENVTLEVTLVLYLQTKEFAMEDHTVVAGSRSMRPKPQWSLTIKEAI